MHDAPEARYEGFRGFFYAFLHPFRCMLEGIRLDEELVSKTGSAFALSGFESPAFR